MSYTANQPLRHVRTHCPGIALANTPDHEPVNVRWSNGKEERMLPESVEPIREVEQEKPAQPILWDAWAERSAAR